MVVALLFVGLVRVLLVVNAPEPTQPFVPTVPTLSAGEVVGRVLSPDQVCALVRPADLADIYRRDFGEGRPVGDVDPDGSPGFDGLCRWASAEGQDGSGAVRVQIRSVAPEQGDDAASAFAGLRSSSDAVRDAPAVADEAFTADAPLGAALTLRADGVVLTILSSDDDRAALEAVALLAVDGLSTGP